MKTKNSFTLLILINIFAIIKNELRIPFKTKLFSNIAPNSITTQEELQNVIINLIHNDIYIDLYIGETPTQQKIQSFLKLEEYPFFIQGKDISSSNYNQTKSSTYKSELYQQAFLDGEEEIKWGYKSNDTIEINNTTNKISMKTFNFILATETVTESPSNIGLMIQNQYTSIPDINFIVQLKKQNVIDYYSFLINYTSYEKGEGEFIIGGPPHLYDSKYNDSYYISDNAIAKPKYMMYGLQFNSINYGNNETNIGGSMQCKFLSDFGLIVGSINYYEVILDKFFNDNLKNNICYKDSIKANIEWREGEKNFEYFYCDKNKVDITKLESIKFYHKKMNFTFEFNYKELFYEIGNYYIYKIIFLKSANFYWIFGKPWLAKYLMVFDQDTKVVGHYYKLNENENNNIDKNNNKTERNILEIIIIIVLIIIISVLGGILCFYIKNRRNRRLNEINDDYDYPQENNQNRLIN
jgi:hypothetical protein